MSAREAILQTLIKEHKLDRTQAEATLAKLEEGAPGGESQQSPTCAYCVLLYDVRNCSVLDRIVSNVLNAEYRCMCILANELLTCWSNLL